MKDKGGVQKQPSCLWKEVHVADWLKEVGHILHLTFTFVTMMMNQNFTQTKLTTVDHGRPTTTMVDHELLWSSTNYHGQKL